MQYLYLTIAVITLVLVVAEDRVHVNKAKTTLFFGTLCWLIHFVDQRAAGNDELLAQFNQNLLEISALWLFLMAAMTFVAYLNHEGLIQNLVYRWLPRQAGCRHLMFIMAGFAFVLSSICDNVTATLVSVATVLALRLEAAVQMRFVVLIVFAVNSGGVALITGDVTTLMIFTAGKADIVDLLLLSLPALAGVLSLATLLSIGVSGHVTIAQGVVPSDPIGRAVAWTFIATVVLALVLNVVAGVPPVLTFLFGLSVMFLHGEVRYPGYDREQLIDYIRRIEFDTLLFFLGILLLVGILKEVGLLDQLVVIYQWMPVSAANLLLGLTSALVDNVPLTAAVLKAQPAMTAGQWLTLIYSVGVGGSLLVIGSAAGIVAMSKVEGVTFLGYARFLPALLLAYLVGYGATMLMGTLLP